ncbi:PilZ domain-containing protein [Marinobacteraceae bacterium S3BR75-40.1]
MHGEYRRHRRSNIWMPVDISYASETLEAKTVDVSTSGMRLQRPGNLFLRPGEKLDITFRNKADTTVPATVAHVGKSHIGLQFYRRQLSEYELRELYSVAPVWQRFFARARRALWMHSRRFGVLAANTFLRRAIVGVVRPHFVFAVYGTEKEADTYFTPGMARRMPPNLVLGFIRNQHMRGLLVASQTFEEELQQDSGKVQAYIDQLRADFPEVQRIALVGRLPNFVKKAGIEISAPLVEGSLGTRYMIWDVARQMKALPRYAQHKSIVVLGGAGRIGNAVCEDLTGEFETVIAFDPRYEEEEQLQVNEGTIIRTSNVARLQPEQLYIGLTHHGDVILDLSPHMPAGSLIADDTHPCISLEAREQLQEQEIAVEKVVLSHEEFLMWPRMPAWNNRDIPGCLVEALVLLQHPKLEGQDFLSFCHEAKKMGFVGRLIRPLDE